MRCPLCRQLAVVGSPRALASRWQPPQAIAVRYRAAVSSPCHCRRPVSSQLGTAPCRAARLPPAARGRHHPRSAPPPHGSPRASQPSVIPDRDDQMSVAVVPVPAPVIRITTHIWRGHRVAHRPEPTASSAPRRPAPAALHTPPIICAFPFPRIASHRSGCLRSPQPVATPPPAIPLFPPRTPPARAQPRTDFPATAQPRPARTPLRTLRQHCTRSARTHRISQLRSASAHLRTYTPAHTTSLSHPPPPLLTSPSTHLPHTPTHPSPPPPPPGCCQQPVRPPRRGLWLLEHR